MTVRVKTSINAIFVGKSVLSRFQTLYGGGYVVITTLVPIFAKREISPYGVVVISISPVIPIIPISPTTFFAGKPMILLVSLVIYVKSRKVSSVIFIF